MHQFEKKYKSYDTMSLDILWQNENINTWQQNQTWKFPYFTCSRSMLLGLFKLHAYKMGLIIELQITKFPDRAQNISNSVPTYFI